MRKDKFQGTKVCRILVSILKSVEARDVKSLYIVK